MEPVLDDQILLLLVLHLFGHVHQLLLGLLHAGLVALYSDKGSESGMLIVTSF